jgi:hypothetical protein
MAMSNRMRRARKGRRGGTPKEGLAAAPLTQSVSSKLPPARCCTFGAGALSGKAGKPGPVQATGLNASTSSTAVI